MASAAPEARKFARGLNKPGTAAELRQSVSEAVRTSVLMVGQTRVFFVLFFLRGVFSSQGMLAGWLADWLFIRGATARDISRLVAFTVSAGRRFLQLSSKGAGLPSN